MSATDDKLSSLAPEGDVATSYQGSNPGENGYAWAVFYVIILTLVIFFIMIYLVPSWKGYGGNQGHNGNHNHGKPGDDEKKKNKRPKVDQTAYGWYLGISLVIAIVIVCIVAHFRKEKKKAEQAL